MDQFAKLELLKEKVEWSENLEKMVGNKLKLMKCPTKGCKFDLSQTRYKGVDLNKFLEEDIEKSIVYHFHMAHIFRMDRNETAVREDDYEMFMEIKNNKHESGGEV